MSGIMRKAAGKQDDKKQPMPAHLIAFHEHMLHLFLSFPRQTENVVGLRYKKNYYKE